VLKAIEARLVDRCKGNSYLEVQIAAGGVVVPEMGVRVPADIAVDRGLLTKATLQSLYEPVTNPKKFYNPDTRQKAYYGELLNTCVYDVDDGVYLLPFGDASPTGASSPGARRVPVISSHRGTEMSAYEAYKGKHISQMTYLFLSRREGEWVEESSVDNNGGTRHILTDGKSGRQICIETAVSQRYLEATELTSYRSGSLSIYELVDLIYSRMGVVEDVNSPIAGLWDATQKKRFSVFQAVQQNLVDRVTALRLLEAQVCTGGILDPASGEKATLKEALGRGLLDQSFALQLPLYEQAYQGVVQPKTGKRISVAQAVQEGVFSKDIGLRCLEFQLLTGGLIDPETRSRISLEEVTRSGFLDKRTLDSLKDTKSYSKSIICPKTRRGISFMEALERSFHDYHTGLRLLEAVRPNWNYRYM
jgi:plectin